MKLFLLSILPVLFHQSISEHQHKQPHRSKYSASLFTTPRRVASATPNNVVVEHETTLNSRPNLEGNSEATEPGATPLHRQVRDADVTDLGESLSQMKSRAISLIDSLDDIRNDLFQMRRQRFSNESARLLESVSTNIAVLSLALRDINGIQANLGFEGLQSEQVNNIMEFEALLNSGENERRKLKSRLMQWSKKWEPVPLTYSIDSSIFLDIIPPTQSNIRPGAIETPQIRSLIAESLLQQDADEDVTSSRL